MPTPVVRHVDGAFESVFEALQRDDYRLMVFAIRLHQFVERVQVSRRGRGEKRDSLLRRELIQRSTDVDVPRELAR